MEKIYNIWNNEWYRQNIKEEIEKTKEKKLIILQPQEYFFLSEEECLDIDNLLIKYNKKLTIYCGAEINPIFNIYKNLKIKLWDSIDFFSRVPFHIENKNTIPSKLLTSLINIKPGRIWRLYINYLFHKHNLYDNNNLLHRVTPDSEVNTDIIFSHLSDIYNYIDDNLIDYLKNDIFKDGYSENPYAQNKCNEHYFESAFESVVETTNYDFFVTEKTLRPINYRKPFFVFSCANFHSKLTRYGFKLYNEIIDYKFDKIENIKERFDTQATELKNINSNYSPEEIYYITKEKVDYNYNILNNIRKINITNVPEKYYNINLSVNYRHS